MRTLKVGRVDEVIHVDGRFAYVVVFDGDDPAVTVMRPGWFDELQPLTGGPVAIAVGDKVEVEHTDQPGEPAWKLLGTA
jgi:hypothetical protein